LPPNITWLIYFDRYQSIATASTNKNNSNPLI
jgi:hypothetical protein